MDTDSKTNATSGKEAAGGGESAAFSPVRPTSQVAATSRGHSASVARSTSQQQQRPASHPQRPVSSSSESGLLLHRPASGRAQDVRHLLTQTFRELFTREPISLQTVRNLTLSKGGDEYHQGYVDRLQKVYEERESRLSQITLLERHLMEAQARALAADQLHKERSSEVCAQLGIPVTTNHYRACADGPFLRSNGLLSPQMYSEPRYTKVKAPRARNKPQFLDDTASFTTSTKGKRSARDRLRMSRLNEGVRGSGEKPTAEVTPMLRGDWSGGDQLDTLARSVHQSEQATQYGMAASQRHTEDEAPTRVAFSQSEGREGLSLQKEQAEKNLWKQQVLTSQRVAEKAELSKLQARANFLKNPRFDPARVAAAAGCEPVFVPLPHIMTFTEYSVGHVYEATLELQNTGTSMEPLRILPPKTSFFSVGLGQFPGKQGLVAPGMRALYKVRFIPDCLGAYEDFITVQCQAGEFPVAIKACRPPPILSFPRVIDCAQCLVRGTKVIKMSITNHGGAGSFCLISEERWPATNFKMAVQPSCVKLPPFEITPSVFELGAGETTPMQIIFNPQTVDHFARSFYVVCDNCETQRFSLRGESQVARVEFVAIDGGCRTPELGELCDKTSDLHYDFSKLNPFTFVQRTLLIKNPTNVMLPFDWKVVKPHLEPPHLPTSNSEEPLPVVNPRARTLDVHSPFSVHPEQGSLPPSSTSSFKVVFGPTEVGDHHSVLHLVLPQIPSQSGALNPGDPHLLDNPAPGHLIDMTSLELEVKGSCVPAQVQLLPYALTVVDPSLIGVTTRRSLQILNKGLSPVMYHWECPKSKHLLEVTPAIGEIEADMFADLEVSLTGCEVGQWDETLYCHIKDAADPLVLHIKFEIKGPEIQVDEVEVRFGLVRFGTSEQREVTVRNQSQMNIEWTACEQAPVSERGNIHTVEGLCVLPSKGTLNPLEHTKLTIDFRPQHCGRLRTFLHVKATDGVSSWVKNIYLLIEGDVQTPEACFLECRSTFPDTFVHLPVTVTCSLVNRTLLETEFTLGAPFGEDVDSCELMFEPSGYLAGRETKPVDITLVSHKLGVVKSLFVPCYVRGQTEPLILSLETEVKGLDVSYSISKSKDGAMPESDSVINFGETKLGTPADMYLHITNLTGLEAGVRVQVEHFSTWSAPPPSPPKEGHPPLSTQHHSRRSLLARTPNIADPNSKTAEGQIQEIRRRYLQTGRGLAILVQPAAVSLAAYSSLTIKLSALSDVWGDYTDKLICCVGDLPAVTFPMKVVVTGVPLQFQMASHQTENANGTDGPVLRFGTHAANAAPIHRNVKINNHGPVDIRLDWELFNVKENDEQLIDFIMNYGEDFPVRDSTGAVVPVQPSQQVLPITRPPSDMIANTPDSSYYGAVTRNTTPIPDSDHSELKLKERLCVTLRGHGGELANQPCSMLPRQLIIPARRSSSVTLSFHPGLGNPEGAECSSFALAYSSLAKEVACVPGKVVRNTGYNHIPLKLNITARIKCASLVCEPLDDEGLRFRMSASDLMEPDGTLRSEFKAMSGVKFTNKTEAILSFTVFIPEPFTYEGSVPAVKSTNHGSQPLISLKPNQSIQVNCGFVLRKSYQDYLETLTPMTWEKEGVPDTEPVALIKKGQERQLCYSGNLTIGFTNGTTQELPMAASVVIPSFQLNKQAIHFGTCLVGERRQEVVLLTNRTAAHSTWRINVSGQSNTCQEDTFEVSPQTGRLEAYLAHSNTSERMLTITFTATDDVQYTCSLCVEGALGEKKEIITLTGLGSFDEKHQNLGNVAASYLADK